MPNFGRHFLGQSLLLSTTVLNDTCVSTYMYIASYIHTYSYQGQLYHIAGNIDRK